MEPIKLEIFINDQTRQGIQSVEGNIGQVKQYMQSVISQLEAEMAGMQKKFQEAMSKGMNTQADIADIQALQGAIVQLREELKKLEEAKQKPSSSPLVDEQQVQRKMNNLKMQFSQVARELPSLAMGPQMFFLAISNNLPMLTDAIKDARKENELLQVSGKKGVPVWKQLGGALFSWNTLLMAGISLLVVYGKDLTNWVNSLFKGKEAVISVAEAQENINDQLAKGADSYGKQVASVKALSDTWKKLGDNLKEKQKFITDNKDEFEKLGIAVNDVDDAENLLVNHTDDFIKAMGLRAAASAAFKLSAEEAEKALKKQMEIDKKKKEGPTTWNKVKSGMVNAIVASQAAGSPTITTTAAGYHKEDIKNLEKEKTAAEDASKAYIDYYNAKMKAAQDLLQGAGIEETEGSKSGKSGLKEKDYATEIAEARLRMQQKVERARINAMNDGYQKRREMARNEYNENILAIDREEKAIIAKMNAARKQGERISDSDYKKVHELAEKQRLLQRKQTNNELLSIDREYYNDASKALIAYNKEYGTYSEKRAAITAEYAQKIFAADNDASRQSLQKQFQSALSALNFSELKQNMNWELIFSDLDKVSKKSLKNIKAQLKALKESPEYQNMGVEQKKIVDEALNDIQVSLIDRGGLLGDLPNQLKNLAIAQDELAIAQNEYNEAVKNGTEAEKENARRKRNKAENNVSNAEKNVKTSEDAFLDKATSLTTAFTSLSEAGMFMAEFGNAVGDLVSVFSQSGSKIGGIIGAIIGLIGEISDKGVDKTIGGILDNVFNAVGSILDTVGGLFGMKGLGGLFKGADYSGYEEMKDKYDVLIGRWDELIDKKNEYINIDYGKEAQKAAEEAERLVETNIKRYRNLLKQLAKSGSSTWSHSLGYRIDERMSDKDWNRISGLIGKRIRGQKDLWDLSSDEIETILQDEKLLSVLDRVNSDFVEYLQNIAEYGNQLEDIAEKEKEAIAGLGFESFRDSLTNMLIDMDSTGEDMADNLEKQLQSAVLKSLVANQYADAIRSLYDSWTNLASDGMSATDAESLRKQQRAIVDKLLSERDRLSEAFGWGKESDKSEIEDLQKAYGKLSEEVSKVYSSERVKAVMELNANLLRQKELIEERLSLTKDDTSMKGLNEQLDDINKQIDENKEAMVDAIFGSDIQSAIESFVSAYTEALGSGDTSGVASDIIQNMIRSMVSEAMKSDAVPVMDAVRKKLMDAWADGIVSEEESAAVEEMINKLNKEFGEKYKWADKLFQGAEIKELKQLQKEYKGLSDALSDAYSGEKIELLREQNKILEKQKKLLEERIGLGGDTSLVDDWKEQLEEVDKQIADNKDAQIDAIFGSDTKNAINSIYKCIDKCMGKGRG